ncbi:MAG: DUF1059 domain-containing protein [bacterium]|nr:DUF1059 domain-containing protein [bacterium]
MKTISCKDMRMDDCSWRGEAATIEELVKQAKEHHKKAHKEYWNETMSDMSDEEIKDMIEPNVKEE